MGFVEAAAGSNILVSDFDGTMTRYDFYRLAIEHLIPADCPDYWSGYRQGRLTHFEALRKYFLQIRASEAEVLAVVDQMELDPELPASLRALRAAGWHVVVTSAGCDWYIQRLFNQAGIRLEVYANPGDFVPGVGLDMRLPIGSPFLSQTVGVDKAGVVKRAQQLGGRVVFAGDGLPDSEAACLVTSDYRFAKSDLAETLSNKQQAFQPFERWSEIANQLLS